jgi:TetR/AcrR family transcriptional regulator, transcriptional repressor for nem operon
LVYIFSMAKHTIPPSQRGRPRNFDIDAAIERAMDVFWSSGYHGTSLPDLLEATNLSRGSLYAAFGDKHRLFLCALDRYIEDALARLDAELDSPRGALAGLRDCLTGYVDRTSGVSGKRGCLLVATTMELSAQDGEVNFRVAKFFRTFEARLTATLTRAQEAGELAEGLEPASVARLLVCLVEGLRVVGKTSPARAKTQAMVETFLDRLTS